MKSILKKLKASYLVIMAGLFLMTSCNKSLEQFAPIPTPVYPTGSGVAATLAANPNYSFYNAMITRSGLTSTLNDLTKTFTIYATDNNGMRLFCNALGVPPGSADAIYLGFIGSSLPVASAAGIIQYNTIGQKFVASSIGTAFPNYPLTSLIILDPTQPFVRMNIFPVRGTPFSYVNNLPIIAPEITAANGVIHTAFSVAAPPTTTLKGAIATEPTLKYWRAAVARGDSGAIGLGRFDSLMNYGVTNMTVLAPNDVAFQGLLIPTITGALIAQGVAPATAAAQATALVNAVDANGNPTVFSNPLLYGSLTAATVKGIVAYHLLASLTTSTTTPYQPNIRVFSNNVASSPMFIKTLVNGAVAVHPGVMAQATFTGPAVTALRFTGMGTFPPGGAPFSGPAANALSLDKHAVNGVYHILDRVLLPQ